MVEYRSFRNSDPPQIVRLWHECELGRGAAKGFTPDLLEQVNFCQPYFDPHGLILAHEDNQLLGLVHAGFAIDEVEGRVQAETGVVTAIMVRPDRRRQGIGRGLLAKAEEYLAGRGTREFRAGQVRGTDPFYFGLYGGARPSGFLETDRCASPFLAAQGYEPIERHGVYQRNLQRGSDPMHFKLLAIRRATELVIADQPEKPSWWWYTHLGRTDSLRFRLTPKSGGPSLASLSVVGLDAYIEPWHARAIGVVDVRVRDEDRGKGYGRALLIEVCRHMRQELIALAEMHAPDTNDVAVKAIQGAGFERIDTGIVYRKGQSPSA